MTRVPNTILHSTFIISVLAFSGVEAAGMNCWDKTISWKKECGYRGAIFVGALLGLIALGFLGWCAFVTLKSRYRNRQRVSVVEESGELLNTGTVADPDPGRGKTEGNVNVGSSKVPPSSPTSPTAASIYTLPEPPPAYPAGMSSLPHYSEV